MSTDSHRDAKHDEGVLTDVARAIGSTLGTVVANAREARKRALAAPKRVRRAGSKAKAVVRRKAGARVRSARRRVSRLRTRAAVARRRAASGRARSRRSHKR
jgi:hypothetical protein